MCILCAMLRVLSKSFFAACVVFLFFAAPAHADTAATTLMQSVHDQARQHKNQSADVILKIEDSAKRQRVRYFNFLYKIFEGRTKSLMKFYKPANIQGTGLLNETLDGAEDTQQWLYLPALRSVKQLNTNEKNKSFMGSDFTNADISGRNVGQDVHRIAKRGDKITVIASTPKDSADPYGRIETHILTSINVPKKIVFYNRDGEKIKTLTNEVIKKIKGMYTPARATMRNHKSGGQTVLEKQHIDVSTRISPNDVGFKGLRK